MAGVAVPEFVLPDAERVARIVAELARGYAPVWLACAGEMVAVGDGRVYMWFASKQKVGDILRREFTWNNFPGALHFKILGQVKRAAVQKVALCCYLQPRGFWYAVHGD